MHDWVGKQAAPYVIREQKLGVVEKKDLFVCADW